MDVAEAIGCSPSEISAYEHGKKLLTVPRLAALCSIYKINGSKLLKEVDGLARRKR